MIAAATPFAENATAISAAIVAVLTGGLLPLVKVWRDIGNLKGRTAALEKEVTKLQEREQELLTELAKARSEVSSRDARIHELEIELAKVQERLRILDES